MSIKTESHEFIGWYEGYHGRDWEVAELRDEIERLTVELDTMNNVHKHLATELADMGRERDELKTLSDAWLGDLQKARAERDRLDKQLIGWMNAFADMSIERDQLRAALEKIIQIDVNTDHSWSSPGPCGSVALRTLAEGTTE